MIYLDTSVKSSETLPENRIVDAILTAISEQRLPAGTKLGEQALSNMFGSNRANVRRALASLAAQHVVDLIPNRGAYVASPSPKLAKDVFDARRALEREIAQKAIERVTAKDIEFLRKNIAAEVQAVHTGEKEFALRFSREFHMTLARIAGNEILERMLSELTMRTTLIIGLYGKEDIISCAEDDHTKIVDALESGDFKRLKQLTKLHLSQLEESLDFERPWRGPAGLREQIFG